MKVLKYRLMTEVNHGTEKNPNIVQTFDAVEIHSPDNVFEANLAIAQAYAYNGEYTIEDDSEPEPPPTTEQRVSDLEEQLVQADETAISLYEAQEAQETINAQQDEALMEIYEMIG